LSSHFLEIIPSKDFTIEDQPEEDATYKWHPNTPDDLSERAPETTVIKPAISTPN